VARPCPYRVYDPPTLTFVFRGAGGTRTRFVDRLPGTCGGEIEDGRGTALADDGLVTRVSRLLGVDFAPNARTAQNQAAAKRDVRILLGLVQLPAGSRPYAGPPLTEQPDPKSKVKIRVVPDGTVHYVNVHRAWTVDLPLASVLAFEKAHRPHGASDEGSGWGGRGSVVTDRELSYSLPGVAGRIDSRGLDFELDRVSDNRTRIHVTAYDNWVVVGSPKERVPAGVREIVVHGPARLARRITQPERIARIVRWFDSLPVAPGWTSFGCWVTDRSPVRIDFLGARGAKLATASGIYNGGFSSICNPIAFSVGGLSYPSLIGDDFLLRVARLPR
jgi:hypothetical protein